MFAIEDHVTDIAGALPVSACLRYRLENPNRLISLLEMEFFFPRHWIASLDKMAHARWALTRDPANLQSLDLKIFESAAETLEAMGFTSSATQARRVIVGWRGSTSTLISEIKELERRIRDDMSNRLFFYISGDKSEFVFREPTLDPDRIVPGDLRLKYASEYFGEEVIKRFPAIDSDLAFACHLYALECIPACVFHLMRATEIAVPKIAILCDVKDPKPSWGSVLDKAEKWTQRTEFKDLEEKVRPHIEFLRTLVADMRSMQRSWRNKIMHVDGKMIVDGHFEPREAYAIMQSTGIFLRHLAADLPTWC